MPRGKGKQPKPYASTAQQALFHADPSLQRYAKDKDKATKDGPGFKSLPKRVGRKKR